MLELASPSIKYKKSFLAAAREVIKEDPGRVEAQVTEETFDAYLNRLENEAVGKNLENGRVQQSQFWLVDGEKYIGRVSVRRRLNEALEKLGGHIGYFIRPTERGKGYGNKILELALQKARETGLEKVFITCDDENVASWKIIEKNGGVLQDNTILKEGEGLKRRYWISLNC